MPGSSPTTLLKPNGSSPSIVGWSNIISLSLPIGSITKSKKYCPIAPVYVFNKCSNAIGLKFVLSANLYFFHTLTIEALDQG